MLYRKSTRCPGFALLVLGVSLAAPQSERRRQFDVPYVPTTAEALRAIYLGCGDGRIVIAAAFVAYVPTSAEAVRAMLKLADVQKTNIVYDPGCGDGRIVIAAAFVAERCRGE